MPAAGRPFCSTRSTARSGSSPQTVRGTASRVHGSAAARAQRKGGHPDGPAKKARSFSQLSRRKFPSAAPVLNRMLACDTRGAAAVGSPTLNGDIKGQLAAFSRSTHQSRAVLTGCLREDLPRLNQSAPESQAQVIRKEIILDRRAEGPGQHPGQISDHGVDIYED